MGLLPLTQLSLAAYLFGFSLGTYGLIAVGALDIYALVTQADGIAGLQYVWNAILGKLDEAAKKGGDWAAGLLAAALGILDGLTGGAFGEMSAEVKSTLSTFFSYLLWALGGYLAIKLIK